MDPEALRRVETALAAVDSLARASDNLRSTAGSRENDPVWPIVDAFAYHYVDPRDEDQQGSRGPFAPLLELQDGVYPQPLREVPAETIDTWMVAVGELTHPAARARLHDLLWERRAPRPDQHARAAIDACLELAALPDWRMRERADALTRALALAQQVNDEDRRTRTIIKIEDMARDWLHPERLQPPGSTLVLLSALTRLPEEIRPGGTRELLQVMHVRHADNPWIRTTVSDLEAMILRRDPESVTAVRRAQIAVWQQMADRDESPFRAMVYLQTALELARTHGQTDLVENLRRQMQDIRIDEEEFQEVSVRMDVPPERIDATVGALLAPEDWRDCLRLFGIYGPPSGSASDNQAAVAKMLTEHPLMVLFPTVRFSEAGIPIRIADDPEDHRSAVLVQHELFGIDFFRGITGRRFLDDFRTQRGVPSQTELAEFFTTDLIGSDRADRIARAFGLYWAGQLDEAAHVIVPRLEAILRDLCRMSGHSVVREPFDERPGGLVTLGSVIEKLRDAIAIDVWPSWWRYLRTTLTDPLGLNLRNRISHGLMDKIVSPDVVVLLHIACFLRLIEPRGQDEAASDE